MRAVRVVLASQSPARLTTLRNAGLDPEVIVSGVDESQVTDNDPAALSVALAKLKAEAVAGQLAAQAPGQISGNPTDAYIIGCDSVLAFDGEIYGKPENAETAVRRWQLMRGSTGVLHTGHCLIDTSSGRSLARSTETIVHFASISDAEIADYVATGEPLQVAGAFTIDGLGGPFVTGIEGDPHTVVGIGLPMLRDMFAELGVCWTDLWHRTGTER
ncbi:MAG: septum formation inhibitor Maf [Nocardioidaceae bacterium]|nr:MAG: septum formation inhibitor Maf [Nocardioidaceae bacterium]